MASTQKNIKIKQTISHILNIITHDKDKNKIRSTTTEQKIDTLTSTLENIFTHDNPPDHYNTNNYKNK